MDTWLPGRQRLAQASVAVSWAQTSAYRRTNLLDMSRRPSPVTHQRRLRENLRSGRGCTYRLPGAPAKGGAMVGIQSLLRALYEQRTSYMYDVMCPTVGGRFQEHGQLLHLVGRRPCPPVPRRDGRAFSLRLGRSNSTKSGPSSAKSKSTVVPLIRSNSGVEITGTMWPLTRNISWWSRWYRASGPLRTSIGWYATFIDGRRAG